MTAEPSATRKKRLWVWILPVCACGLLFSFASFLYFDRGISKSGEMHLWIRGISAELGHYRAEYGELPTGSDAEIMAKLQGDNPRKIVFYRQQGPDHLNAKGQVVDPWDTPYRFETSDPKNPRVWSCGPNRRDDGGAEGSDDIVSWR